MLTAYFDDSGTHAGARVIGAAGFIGECTIWSDIDKKWKPLLVSPHGHTISEFKMYDCVHGTGEFSRPEWGFADRLHTAGKVVDILSADEADVMAIGSTVHTGHIAPLMKFEWFSEKLHNHTYYLCFEHCLQMAVNWTKRRCDATGVKEGLAIIFDEQGEFTDLAHAIYKEYKKSSIWGEWLISYTEASSKDFTPLQAADFLAYSTVDMNMRRYYPDNKRPDFPVGPVFDRLLETVARAGGVYDDDSLPGLVRHMIEVDEAKLEEVKKEEEKRRLEVEKIRNTVFLGADEK